MRLSRYPLTLFILLLWAGGLAAQSRDASLRVQISATLDSSIEVETISNISFGRVIPGMEELVINPRLDPGAGLLRVSGRPNSIIRVSFLEQREIYRVGGGQPLLFTYIVSGGTENNQLNSEPITTENRQLTLSSQGEYFFWIGGRLNLAGIDIGEYEGEFALEIDYL